MRDRVVHMDIVPEYKVGDPCPDGYTQWHEWARVQHRGGLRQAQCPDCGLWLFPQERAGHKCEEAQNA
jgi:uncharacterized OB-fold protein